MHIRRKVCIMASVVVTGILASLVYLFVRLDGQSDGSLNFAKSSLDWSTVPQRYPVSSLTPLPTGAAKALPRVQFDFPTPGDSPENATIVARRNAVRDAFLRSWSSYKSHAWLHDELTPVTGSSKDPHGGWGVTIVDNLDTLWIMDLKDEFYLAAQAAAKIDWNKTDALDISPFETNIRYLGGLLSAYELSGEHALLRKAQELGDMLYMAFDTPNRMPAGRFDFDKAQLGNQFASTRASIAGSGTFSMEFARLSQLTGQDKYYDAIDRVRAFFDQTQNQTSLPGMWPVNIDLSAQSVEVDNTYSLGGGSDSMYEYLLKMYILLAGQDDKTSYERMYLDSAETIIDQVLFRPMLPNQDNIALAGKVTVYDDTIHLDPRMEHLACFTGGMLGLGGKIFGIAEHVDIGDRLARGCAWAYQALATGVMPEAMNVVSCRTASLQACEWSEDRWENEGTLTMAKGIDHVDDPVYVLRPEALESLFIMYRITGKEDLRDLAWTMFQSILNATTTEYGYSSIKDVTTSGITVKKDSMESFWLAETLKYMYLIFSPPDVISLDDYVLNTEAHPFLRDLT